MRSRRAADEGQRREGGVQVPLEAHVRQRRPPAELADAAGPARPVDRLPRLQGARVRRRQRRSRLRDRHRSRQAVLDDASELHRQHRRASAELAGPVPGGLDCDPDAPHSAGAVGVRRAAAAADAADASGSAVGEPGRGRGSARADGGRQPARGARACRAAAEPQAARGNAAAAAIPFGGVDPVYASAATAICTRCARATARLGAAGAVPSAERQAVRADLRRRRGLREHVRRTAAPRRMPCGRST